MKCLGDSGKLLLFTTLSVAFISAPLFAGSAQMRGARTSMYDPKTETTINGVVQEVKKIPGPGRRTGTHLIVKASDASYEVHVGPTWFLTQEKYTFAKGDHVEVVGSKVKFQGTDAILARQITKNGTTWTLRDAQGVPRWSRQKSG